MRISSLRNRKYFRCGILLALLVLLIPILAQAQEISDPIEPINRGVFWFNEQVDRYFLEPVARGYRWVLPQPARTGVSNFFNNLRSPVYLVSDIFQLKFEQAGVHTVRFLLNTTIGIGGLFDPAAHFGFEHHYEDFGITLASYGVPSGPYLVIPFFGPSNVRDAFGRIVDAFAHPFMIPTYLNAEDPVRYGVPLGGRLVEGIDDRSRSLEAIEDARASALDFYLFSQAAYYQHRDSLIYDGIPPEDELDELEEELEFEHFEEEFDETELE